MPVSRDRPPMLEAVASLPSWVTSEVDYTQTYVSDEERMRFVISLARGNVEHRTGGPFAAAIFERGAKGRLVSVGVNSVIRLNNSTSHAEMLAFQLAQKRLASHTLAGDGTRPEHELFTSCAPCAMCLGATLWSGVTRIVSAATREDAESIAFDEGPVFPESYRYLEKRGVAVVGELLRADAQAVMGLYRRLGGEVY